MCKDVSSTEMLIKTVVLLLDMFTPLLIADEWVARKARNHIIHQLGDISVTWDITKCDKNIIELEFVCVCGQIITLGCHC